MEFTTLRKDLIEEPNSTAPNFWVIDGLKNLTEKDKEHYETKKETFVYGIMFLSISLFMAVLCREKTRHRHFPYTVLVFGLGILYGILDLQVEAFHHILAFVRLDIVTQLFLPVILYDAAFGIDPHMFYISIGQCLLLAIPGFLFCTALTTVFAKYILDLYKWDWKTCCLFGIILSATDPVSVSALLKDWGISASLTAIIEGESLLNNGASIVIFRTSLYIIEHEEAGGAYGFIIHMTKSSIGAVAFGYLISMGTIALLRRLENDDDVEVTFTFCITYITYFTSEIFLEVSGIFAVVILGISVSAYKSSINYEEGETTVHQFWDTLSFWATTLTFTIVAIIVTTSALRNFAASDLAFIIATYFAVSLIRFCMVVVLRPLLKSIGYGFTWKHGLVVSWGGLRGVVGIALALLMRYSVPQIVEDKILIQVSGVIVFTLVFNATTMRMLLKFLGIGQVTSRNIESMSQAICLLQDAVATSEKTAKMDKYLTNVDWMWVRKITILQNPYDGIQLVQRKRKLSEADIETEVKHEDIRLIEEEARLQILSAMEGSVFNQHSRYGVLRRTLKHLITCIEDVADVPEKYLRANDIKRKFLEISRFTKFLKIQMMRLMIKLNIENRMEEAEMQLREIEKHCGRFRKWCLSFYLSRRYGPIVYWALILNVIPIAAELAAFFNRYSHFKSKASFEKEMLVFELYNGILTLFYIFDMVIRIGSLGCRKYFSGHGNKLDSLVTLTASAHLIFAIVLIAGFRETYTRTSIDALILMGTVRLLRLLRMTVSGIFKNIMDEVCSYFYNAFDLAIGFITANEEIAKSASQIVEYEPSADIAQFTAENNIHEMLSYLEELDADHFEVTCAWKTHRATVYILRDMKNLIEEMEHTYMIDEVDAEQLMEQISLKMKDTLCAPRYLKVTTGIRNILENVMWIINDEMLDKILDNMSRKSLISGEILQNVGKEHTEFNVISSGIIQISGKNTGMKDIILPNTDSPQYFAKIGTFSVYVISPETIGLLGYLLQTPSVTTASCSKECELISIDFKIVKEAERMFPDLDFFMWRSIALEIAFLVLKDEETYENWSDARLRIHLEEGIFPDLEDITSFELHPVIVDAVLIQGTVVDPNTDITYIGPDYIPNTVRMIHLVDDPKIRPRVVMVLLREDKFHSRAIMGWIKPSQITYKGLCLVHGIKRADDYDKQKLNDAFKGHKLSFVKSIGQLLKPKNESILPPEEP